MRKTPKMVAAPVSGSVDNGRKNRTLGDGVLTPNQRVIVSLYRRDAKGSNALSARVKRKGW